MTNCVPVGFEAFVLYKDSQIININYAIRIDVAKQAAIRRLNTCYQIVRKDGKIVRDSENLNIDDILKIQFSTGSAETKVKKID